MTPEGLAKELDTTILNVVSTVGQLGILSRHVPLVTPLAISRMITEESDGRRNTRSPAVCYILKMIWRDPDRCD
ncbi:MAG: hypothetical protein ACLSA6_03285 [Holdemania massiliensis]